MMIQWYPGHMNKTMKTIEENLKLTDVVLEVVDARLPMSSQNPSLANLISKKARILILNKSDLADPKLTLEWISYFSAMGIRALAIDSLKRTGIKATIKTIRNVPIRGRLIRPTRAMVIGIPNVGKSAFINALVGRAHAKTGNKPGTTRGSQWIKIKDDIQLLDTPGVLWPRLEDHSTGLSLVYIHSVGSKAYDVVDVALRLIERLQISYPEHLKKLYRSDISMISPDKLLEGIGKSRGFLKKGGIVDPVKASEYLLKTFQDGRLGRITFEKPPRDEDA